MTTPRAEQIARWESELSEIARSISWRWGESRRFQSNGYKIARRNWLIEHIATERTRP